MAGEPWTRRANSYSAFATRVDMREIAKLRRKGHLLKTIFFLPPASAMDHAVLGRLLRLLGVSDGTLARVGLELAHGQAAIALSFPSMTRAARSEPAAKVRSPKKKRCANNRRSSRKAAPIATVIAPMVASDASFSSARTTVAVMTTTGKRPKDPQRAHVGLVGPRFLVKTDRVNGDRSPPGTAYERVRYRHGPHHWVLASCEPER